MEKVLDYFDAHRGQMVMVCAVIGVALAVLAWNTVEAGSRSGTKRLLRGDMDCPLSAECVARGGTKRLLVPETHRRICDPVQVSGHVCQE